ncbi:Copia protein, partial [Mucuna pruriens]
MSMMGELKFFLRHQIRQIDDGIYIHQTKYDKKLLKKFKLDDYKSMSTLLHPTFVSYCEYDKKVDQTKYKVFKLNPNLCSKQSYKYKFKGYLDVDYVGDRIERKSTSEATLDQTPIKSLLCDNITTINLSKNPILHSRPKHIKIKHHFTRYYIQKGIFDIKFISTNEQLVDIFTKPLDEDKLIHI